MIGTHLTALLVGEGYEVIILSREPAKYQASAYVQYAGWDIDKNYIEEWAIRDAHAVIHLAGAGVVDRPWTDQYKREILESRTKSAALLVHAMRTIPNQIATVISGSAIGYYPETTEDYASVESDTPANGFLGETCVAWEQSMQAVQDLGKRLVYVRTGIVLSRDGGALKEFLKPLYFHIAGILGNGKQIISWIHIDDLCKIFVYALQQDGMQGPYNGVAPHPVSNRILNLALAKAMHGKAFIAMPVPAFVLKIMLGERSIEVLKSANVSAEKLLAEGFRFQFNTIDAAANALMQHE